MGESGVTNGDLSTYCGLYCGACGIKNGRVREAATSLKKLLDAYAYPEWAPMVADWFPETKYYPEFEGVLKWLETQDCPACRGGGGNPDCAIRICAKERGYSGCWECTDFDAGCDKLQEIAAGYPELMDNLRRIAQVGLDPWVQEQAARVEERVLLRQVAQKGQGAMRPKVILYNAVSADGRLDWFEIDLGSYYGLISRWNEGATLAGSGTLLAPLEPIPTKCRRTSNRRQASTTIPGRFWSWQTAAGRYARGTICGSSRTGAIG